MRLELDNGRRLFVALCVALSLAYAAQTRAQAEGQRRAWKVSDYVNQFTTCNAGAHLDNFAIELQNNPSATGHILIYGPEQKYGERAVKTTRGYLVNVRGIEESRLQAVYAGRYQNMNEVLSELWLVPEGATPPPMKKYKPDFAFEGRFYEKEFWDGPDTPGDVEGWSTSSEAALVGLSEIFSRRKDASVYLVVYHSEETAPGAWRRVTEAEAEKLRGYGIPAERIKTIFGGYAKESSLQIWINPSNAPPVKRRRERRPERSVKVAGLDQNMLNYDADWAYRGLVDVLKADPQLTACLVVRPGPAEVDDVNPEEPVDPVQLAEKWKAEFKRNGIGEQRLIIMVVPTREEQWGAELETWVVPPGASLPDPSAGDVVDTVEEEAENP